MRDSLHGPQILISLARMKSQPRVLAIVLAGGEGKRLFPLTADRAKPAVPFGGNYRLIDFVLSNLVNAGYMRIAVLTQYKSHSLDRHVATAWNVSGPTQQYIASVPAQQRRGKRWYSGSADAIVQSLNLIYDDAPDYVLVLGADHVYRMDFSDMVEQHLETGADCTVAAIRQPIAMADQFGVIDVDGQRLSYVASGTIKTAEAPRGDLPQRIRLIFEGVREVVATYEPDTATVEIVFVNVNPQSTLLLGQARGAALAHPLRQLHIEHVERADDDRHDLRRVAVDKCRTAADLGKPLD